MLVDNAAMQLVSEPARFDVILTENMFGDILSDEAAMLTGSLGMLPSASLGGDGPGRVRAGARLGPRHRRARASANPLATFLSVAMMLRHGLGMAAEADAARAGGRGGARARAADAPTSLGAARRAGRAPRR